MDRIFRWTIGDSSRLGVLILDNSIKSAKKVFEKFHFDFYVCLNSEDSAVEEVCRKNNVKLFRASWDSFPLPKEIIPEDYDLNSKPGEPKGRQGSFWKMCPPRLFINSYEIVCDNDVIFQRCPSEIEFFLNSNKCLVVEENIFSFGKYKKHISKPYNSGLYGLPPGYDFNQRLLHVWEQTGGMRPLLSRDEQGIIILTLISDSCIEIPKEKTCFVFDQGETDYVKYEWIKENQFDSYVVKKIFYKKSSLKGEMIHFLGSNRSERHFYWQKFKNKLL